MTTLTPNLDAIRTTYHWLAHSPHGVSEVRVIRPGGTVLGIGFFDDEEAFVRECARANAAGNVYVGIQPRPRRLLPLATNAIRPLRTGASAKDIDTIVATVVDIDPVRPKDAASTDAELARAVVAAETAASWCESEGLVRPRVVMSGNGTQLWFALPPTPLGDRRELLQRGMKAFEAQVRARVQSDAVHVDSIHDVARIIKVVGTISHKGDGAADRPYRVSSPLSDVRRIDDARLLARLEEEPTPALPLPPAPRVSLPVLPLPALSLANRMPDGAYDWQHPVEMCGPVQRLWDQGADDRSVAIFNMVRFFAHKGLGLDEITDLILEYDRRGLGKLTGRDGATYVRQAYEKVLASTRQDGTVAPPCHALQKLHYCRVNREPDARCELYDFIFDIESAIEAVPTDTPASELAYRLKPILEAIAHRDPSFHGQYLHLLQTRFGLRLRDIRTAIRDTRNDGSGTEPEDVEDILDGEIYEDARVYYCRNSRGGTRVISTFTIQPKMRIVSDAGQFIEGDAHPNRGPTIPSLRLPLTAFHSKRDLIRHLPSADLQWTGSDNNVQGLLRLLARRAIPQCLGSTILGEYKTDAHHVWLGPDKAIGKSGFLEPTPVVYVPNGGTLASRLDYRACDDETFRAIAEVVFRYLLDMNEPGVSLPVVGWFFATPMKPALMQLVGSFPALFIWGTQGSGKSSICADIMWPLFGIRDSEPYSATETEFALIKLLSSTGSVPVFIDEYKPYDMPRNRLNTLHRYVRRLYRGEFEERGRPDLKVNHYHLQAPLCIAGETRPTEAALLERMITANPSKRTIDMSPAYRRAYDELRAVDLALFAPRYIQFCLSRSPRADLDVARNAAQLMLEKRKVPVRVVQNVTTMLLGLHLFEEFAKFCGCAIPAELDVRRAIDAVLSDVLEGGHAVKNALDHFLEMLGIMAVQGFLKHGTHYVLHHGLLAVHLETAYDAFRSHCKQIDYAGEVVDMKALRRLISENRKQDGYVVAEGERALFDGGARRRAVLIDLEKTYVATADDFPAFNAARGHDSGHVSRYATWKSS